jgi:hypothetical protein
MSACEAKPGGTPIVWRWASRMGVPEGYQRPETPSNSGGSIPWCPLEPTERQRQFLGSAAPELLFGGAAGGGKSIALLMGALQFVDTPGYSAIIFRRTVADLLLPGALIPRSFEWLGGTEARWSHVGKRWTFPSGATLSFGYLHEANDRFRYQSSEFQYIAFDELTHFRERDYLYLRSRLRRPERLAVPLRIRAASNPGGVGHVWVRKRFLEGPADGRLFLPARLEDNPHLDADGYRDALAGLDELTRRQLEQGDWSTNEETLISWDDLVGCVDPDLVRVPSGADAWRFLPSRQALEWSGADVGARFPASPPEDGAMTLAPRASGTEGPRDRSGRRSPSLAGASSATGRSDTMMSPWAGRFRTEAGERFAGIDPARSPRGDRSVLWIWERVGDVLVCRELVALRGASFARQFDEFRRRLEAGGVCRALIDETGLGMQLAEELTAALPGVAVGVPMSAGFRTRIALQLAARFAERRVRIPDDGELRDDFLQVRRTGWQGPLPTIESERGPTGHADRFWAAALAAEAARTVIPPPRVARPRW